MDIGALITAILSVLSSIASLAKSAGATDEQILAAVIAKSKQAVADMDAQVAADEAEERAKFSGAANGSR